MKISFLNKFYNFMFSVFFFFFFFDWIVIYHTTFTSTCMLIAVHIGSQGKFEIPFSPFEDLFQQNGISQRESSHKFSIQSVGCKRWKGTWIVDKYHEMYIAEEKLRFFSIYFEFLFLGRKGYSLRFYVLEQQNLENKYFKY